MRVRTKYRIGRTRRAAGAVAFLTMVVLVGCEMMQSGAPPVNAAMVRTAAADGGTSVSLERGRQLLAQRCTGCHGLEPVTSYSPSEWRGHVREMADRAGLDPQEAKLVADYLAAARMSSG